MAGALTYRITQHPWPFQGMSISPHAGRIVKTGNILAGSIASAPVSIPKQADQTDTTATLEWVGSGTCAYVEVAGPGQPAPTPTPVHAAEDAKIRIFLRSGCPVTIPVPPGGSFAVIQAAEIPA